MAKPHAFTVADVATRFGVSNLTVYTWLNRGLIVASLRVPGRIAFTQDDVDAFARRREEKTPVLDLALFARHLTEQERDKLEHQDAVLCSLLLSQDGPASPADGIALGLELLSGLEALPGAKRRPLETKIVAALEQLLVRINDHATRRMCCVDIAKARVGREVRAALRAGGGKNVAFAVDEYLRRLSPLLEEQAGESGRRATSGDSVPA